MQICAFERVGCKSSLKTISSYHYDHDKGRDVNFEDCAVLRCPNKAPPPVPPSPSNCAFKIHTKKMCKKCDIYGI